VTWIAELATRFDRERRRRQSVAYGSLGSLSEADDAGHIGPRPHQSRRLDPVDGIRLASRHQRGRRRRPPVRRRADQSGLPQCRERRARATRPPRRIRRPALFESRSPRPAPLRPALRGTGGAADALCPRRVSPARSWKCGSASGRAPAPQTALSRRRSTATVRPLGDRKLEGGETAAASFTVTNTGDRRGARTWVAAWNENPKPFIWTRTAEQILESPSRLLQRINGGAH
jgi:hypothetical protein